MPDSNLFSCAIEIIASLCFRVNIMYNTCAFSKEDSIMTNKRKISHALCAALAFMSGGVVAVRADSAFDYSGRTAAVENAPAEAVGSNAAAIDALHYTSTSKTGLRRLGMSIIIR